MYKKMKDTLFNSVSKCVAIIAFSIALFFGGMAFLCSATLFSASQKDSAMPITAQKTVYATDDGDDCAWANYLRENGNNFYEIQFITSLYPSDIESISDQSNFIDFGDGIYAEVDSYGDFIHFMTTEQKISFPASCAGLFKDCSSLTTIDLTYVDTSNVTDMSEMFYGCSDLQSLDLSSFDTSNVTDMSNMFYGCYNLETLDLSSFNTSNVTNMSNMFGGYCENLTDINFGDNFTTYRVTDMSEMFYYCTSLQSLGSIRLSGESATSTAWMFYGCSSLETLDLKWFSTPFVTDMSYMFWGCENLSTLIVDGLMTSNVTNMSYMFCDCKSLTKLYLTGFVTVNVTKMQGMFTGCESLTDLELGPFITSNVTDMTYMFAVCSSLETVDLSNFDTSNVTTMEGMFQACYNLKTLDLSSFNTSKVTNMSQMFWECNSLTTLNLSGFNTSNVKSMGRMFDNCSSLTYLDLSSFDTSKIGGMWRMFGGCSSLTSLNLSGFDTSSVSIMGETFNGCSNLREIDLSSFDTSNVWRTDGMFQDCSSLEKLNLSNFSTSKVRLMSRMFSGCTNLTELTFGENFDVSSATDMPQMFAGCTALKELDLTGWDMSSVETDKCADMLSNTNIKLIYMPTTIPENVTIYINDGSTYYYDINGGTEKYNSLIGAGNGRMGVGLGNTFTIHYDYTTDVSTGLGIYGSQYLMDYIESPLSYTVKASNDPNSNIGRTFEIYTSADYDTKIADTNGRYLNTVPGYTSNGTWVGESVSDVYARSTAIPYSITFNQNGGDWKNNFTPPTDYTVDSATITLPTAQNITKTGYAFAGWYENADFNGNVVTTIASGSTGNKEYWAKWIKNTYNITWQNEDGTELDKQVLEYGSTPQYAGALPTKNSTAQYDYTFAGWAPAISNVTSDAVYTATFTNTIRQYDLTIIVDENVVNKPSVNISINNENYDIDDQGHVVVTMQYGTNLNIKATLANSTNKYNLAWDSTAIEAEELTTSTQNELIEGNKELTLHITQIFAVNASTNSQMGEIVGANSKLVLNGGNVSFTAQPNRGYKFVNWSNSDAEFEIEGEETCTVKNVQSNGNIVANFETVFYKITLNINNKSDVIEYTINQDKIEIENPTRKGYVFVGWTGSNGDEPEKDLVISADTAEDLSFDAQFEKATLAFDNIILLSVAISSTVIILGTVIITLNVRRRRKTGKKVVNVDLSKLNK